MEETMTKSQSAFERLSRALYRFNARRECRRNARQIAALPYGWLSANMDDFCGRF
jgi:hypothetical protein